MPAAEHRGEQGRVQTVEVARVTVEAGPGSQRLPQDLGGGAHVQPGERSPGGGSDRGSGGGSIARGAHFARRDAQEAAGVAGEDIESGQFASRVELRFDLRRDQHAGQADIDRIPSDDVGELTSCSGAHRGFASVCPVLRTALCPASCPASCSALGTARSSVAGPAADLRTGRGGTRRPATRSSSATVTMEPSLVRIVRRRSAQDNRCPTTSVSGNGPATRRRTETLAPVSAGVIRTTYTTSERPCCRHRTVEVDTRESVAREPRRNNR